MIIKRYCEGVLIKGHSGNPLKSPFIIYYMSNWAKWQDLCNKGYLKVLSYGTPSNYGHIEICFNLDNWKKHTKKLLQGKENKNGR